MSDLLHRLDRVLIRFVNLSGLWAIGTPLEPLVTGRPSVKPATDSDVTLESVGRMQGFLEVVTRGYRNWMAAGVVLSLASTTAIMMEPSPLGAMLLAISLIIMPVWIIWVVVRTVQWGRVPEWSQIDSVSLALKRRVLGEEALNTLRALPETSLLATALSPLLRAQSQSR